MNNILDKATNAITDYLLNISYAYSDYDSASAFCIIDEIEFPYDLLELQRAK